MTQGVNDAAVADLVAEEAMDPPYLMSLGMSQTAAEAILAAISSPPRPPPRGKVLIDDDILDAAAARQEALETSLTARQAEVKAAEGPQAAASGNSRRLLVPNHGRDPMEDPCIVADGRLYERREIVRHFDLGRRTSPMTGSPAPTTPSDAEYQPEGNCWGMKSGSLTARCEKRCQLPCTC